MCCAAVTLMVILSFYFTSYLARHRLDGMVEHVQEKVEEETEEDGESIAKI